MADNITLNAGAGGATLGSDEVTIGGVLQQVQRMKLVDGTDGGTALIGGSAANGLQVDVTRVGGNVSVIGPAADGAALSGAPVRIAGSDGTLVQDISVTSAGHVQIQDGGNSITVDNGGTFAVQATEADGANVTLGAKADAKSTATDTTAVTAMSVWKQISSSVQAIATSVAGTLTVAAHNVTNAGTFAVQATEADGANVTLGAKADAKSTATDATAITIMSALKQVSASVQAAAASLAGTLTVGTHAVTQSGTWTVQPGNTANTTAWKVDGSAVTQPVSVAATVAVSGPLTDTQLRASAVPVSLASAPTTAVTQSGTWTVQPGNTANTTAWKVDGSAVTQPVSGTVSVNTHDVGAITTSVTPGTGAAHLGKAEDAAHTSGDTGVMAFAVRRDADTSLVDTTGDYAPLQVNAAGSLKVAITAGAGSGGTSLADNAGFTPGATSFTPIGGEVDDTGTTAATENSAAAARITPQRALHVNLRDNTGAELAVGGGTQYDEDTVSTAADKITMAGVVRKDAVATLVDTDGDRTQLQVTAAGRLWASATIDAALPAGTNAIGKLAANTGVTIGAVEIAAAQTLGTVSTVTSLTQMNGAAISMGTGVRGAGVQRVTIATDDVVPASQSGTWTVQPGNTANTTAWKVDASSVAVPVTDNSGSLTVDAPVGTPAFVRLSDGAAAITTLPVSLATAPSTPVTNVGTFAVQAVDAGDVAHDGVDSGNPVKLGAQARSSEPAAVSTNADRVNLIADMVGKLITLPYANPENSVSGAITSAMSGTTTTSLLAAPASGLRNYITQITVSNAHATVGTDIVIQDGSGGTTLYTIPAAANYGGATLTFPVPLRQPTTATAIFCANVTTGASTKVSASGYKGV